MKKEKLKIIIAYALVVIWMVVIFVFSNMDSDVSTKYSEGTIDKVIGTVENIKENVGITSNVTPEKKEEIVKTLNLPVRKLTHFTEYLILCMLLINAFSLSKIKYKYLIAIIVSILYAFTDEFHQIFIDGRCGKLIDVLIDTTGAIVGSLIFYLGYRIVKARNAKKA